MKRISVLEPRKFDAELSAVPVKRLNLSIVFLIRDKSVLHPISSKIALSLASEVTSL